MLLYHSHGQATEFFSARKIKIYFSSTAVKIEGTVWIRKKLTTYHGFTQTFLVCSNNDIHIP